ncbi:MAG TPA: Rrf2 family transcriptional regulator [Thermoanaerobaculia bacterium]|nr:Rrf2 family transcriptional regulator [Thermoanaerobaculia bacterium]
MKISTKGEYGIRAMLYIAMHAENGPVTSHEIAGHQGIPEPYLRQILALLSKDRLIQSNRGPQGGHLLGRLAASISLRDILLTLEGQTTAIDQILALPCSIDVGTEHCAIREVFLEVKEAIDRILAAATLEDLVNRQLQVSRQQIAIPLDLPSRSPLARLPIIPG